MKPVKFQPKAFNNFTDWAEADKKNIQENQLSH